MYKILEIDLDKISFVKKSYKFYFIYLFKHISIGKSLN